jgi:hypothetical protein
LVKLQVAQSQSANLAPVEARFAGLAFAARADWTPVATSRGRSLEALAPFSNIALARPRSEDAVTETAEPAESAAPTSAGRALAREVPAAEPAPPALEASAKMVVPTSIPPEAVERATDGLGAGADAPSSGQPAAELPIPDPPDHRAPPDG